MKNHIIFLILLFSFQSLQAQFEERESRFDNTANNIYKGTMSAVKWYDLPIGIAYFARTIIQPENIGNIISLPPTRFEENISGNVGRTGNNSFGSLDQDFFPNLVFFSRLAYTASLNLFTDADVTSNNFRDILLFKKSLIYTYTLTEYVKSMVKRERPDKSDTRSFFSGHTSTTFAASTYLFLELDDFYDDWKLTRNNNTLRNIFKFTSFGVLYGWAGYVGYSRIKDNKHYITDVLIGASVGTLVSTVIYNLYHNKDEEGVFGGIGLYSTGQKEMGISFNLSF